MDITGFRTIIVAIIGGVVTPFLANHVGITLTPDQQTAAVSATMAALMVLMRFATSTAVGKKTPPTLLPPPANQK
jgi:hypothetical protein